MKKRAIFLGSKAFGLAMFRQMVLDTENVDWCVIHPNDSSDARSVLKDFKSEAVSKGFPFKVVESRREAAAFLSSETFDIGFVCGWYWLLDSTQVGDTAPPLYGIHHSALPKFRGGAPIVWALLSGEKLVGSTLFRLTPGMDDGPIVAQVTCPVTTEMSIAHVLEVLEDEWSKSIGKVWQNLVNGTANEIEQDGSLATYCAQRRPDDGRINWHAPAETVHNFIRAQAFPYPGAFTTTCDGKRITIDRSVLFASRYHAIPGQILQRSSSTVLVGCGNSTALYISSVREYEDFGFLKGRFLE